MQCKKYLGRTTVSGVNAALAAPPVLSAGSALLLGWLEWIHPSHGSNLLSKAAGLMTQGNGFIASLGLIHLTHEAGKITLQMSNVHDALSR